LFDTHSLSDVVKGAQQDAFKVLLGAVAVFCKEYVLPKKAIDAILFRCKRAFKTQQEQGEILMTFHAFFHFVVGEEDETVAVSMNVVDPATYFATGGGAYTLLDCRKMMVDSHNNGLLQQLLLLEKQLPFTATPDTSEWVRSAIVKTLQLTTDFDWFVYLTRLASSTCKDADVVSEQNTLQAESWKQTVKFLLKKERSKKK
jgi:hypothetical protein